MSVFASTDELYEVFTPFYESIVSDPVLGAKFVAANTSFRINHVDPTGVFLLDTTQDPPVLTVGEAATAGTPEVELTMSGDDGHKFWLGQLNLPVALAKRKVKVDGPITKLLGLLPALQPAFVKYKEHLAATGRDALV